MQALFGVVGSREDRRIGMDQPAPRGVRPPSILAMFLVWAAAAGRKCHRPRSRHACGADAARLLVLAEAVGEQRFDRIEAGLRIRANGCHGD